MKVLIVGCGRVGQNLAEKLSGDGNEVTVIDMASAKVREITGRFDVMGVVGNGATPSTLREAGIRSTELFIAVTNSDELNLLCCMIAKKEGARQTIARVKNPEYSTEAEYLKGELGLAMVINPEYEAAQEIARVLRFPTALKIEPFAGGRVELIKFKLAAESPLVGSSIKDVMLKYRADLLFATVERGDEAYIANGDFVFEDKDVVSIVASPKNAYEFFAAIRCKGHAIKNALIVGGGVITHYLLEILEKSGLSLKVIEKDSKICDELAGAFPKFNVICGNPADKELLKEEGLASADAFVALSNVDEENILLSLFAQDETKGKLITKINRTDYDGVVSRLELDTTICPLNITSDQILRYARSRRKASGSNIQTLYNIIPGKVEAAEFVVKERSPIVGKPLCELRFKENVLVAAIYRDKKVIVPRGNDAVQAGDAVVIITKALGITDVAEVLR